MTEEVERLRIEYMVAVNARKFASGAEDAAKKALDAANVDAAKEDLIARGIIIGETPVYGGNTTYSGTPYWNTRNAAVVSGVTSDRGTAYYRLTRLTKGGKVSRGHDAVLGGFKLVRPVREVL